MTLIVAAFNIRKIATFINDLIHEAATGGPKEPIVRKRDREHHNPYTGTYPPGVVPPNDKKPLSDDGDGTGGPPLRE